MTIRWGIYFRATQPDNYVGWVDVSEKAREARAGQGSQPASMSGKLRSHHHHRRAPPAYVALSVQQYPRVGWNGHLMSIYPYPSVHSIQSTTAYTPSTHTAPSRAHSTCGVFLVVSMSLYSMTMLHRCSSRQRNEVAQRDIKAADHLPE